MSVKTHIIAEQPYCTKAPCPTVETYVRMHDQRHADLCAKMTGIALDVKELPVIASRQKIVMALLTAMLLAIVGDWISAHGFKASTGAPHAAVAASGLTPSAIALDNAARAGIMPHER